jgi:hypothetical protein
MISDNRKSKFFALKIPDRLLRKAFALLRKSKANVRMYADAFDLLVFEALVTSACLSKNMFFDKQRGCKETYRYSLHFINLA